ncbi:MAG: hypothetical protein U0Z53_23155 [Blastocatellia bacterium]
MKQIKFYSALLACYATLILCSANASAQSLNARYSYRVPDWLWTQQRFTGLITAEVRRSLESEIKILNVLDSLEDRGAYDEKNEQLASKISKLLALRDLTAEAPVFENQAAGTKLAIQVDPAFSEQARQTILNAARLFIEVALDDLSIRKSIETSTVTPPPMPEMYELIGDTPVQDVFGNKVYTPEYARYLQRRAKPESVGAFKQYLHHALSTSSGDPALLVISQYSGNVWWGGSYLDFYSDNLQQLSRLNPPAGFLYIRLNSDRMVSGEPDFNNPAFWAAKIAHEVLHNLGYWHPNYTDPAQRDQYNQGNTTAFIVAYEREVFARLSERKQ